MATSQPTASRSRALRGLTAFMLAALAATKVTFVTASDVLRVMLEEPVAGETHGGVGNLRGWAVASEGIEKIEIWIDGAYAFDAPYGGSRGDVSGAYPEVSDSDKSGFSLAYAYSNLSPGSHTISAVAHTTAGNTRESAANFTVVKFKDAFISGPNAVDLSGTSCEANGDEVSASSALIGGYHYDMVLDWRTAEQGFEIVEISERDVGGDNTTGSGSWSPPDGVEWIPYDFNKSGDQFCEDADGFCAGWLETASQECRNNFKLGDSPEATQSRRDNESCASDMVFRPYISMESSRTTLAPSQDQKDTAARLRESGWDQTTSQPVSFRSASDIPDPIVEASKEGMFAAIDWLGNYGPLRVYLVGNDLTIAEELVEDFCEWNYPRDQSEQTEYCLEEDQGESIREMAYMYPGCNGFQQSSWFLDEPVQSFVHNPCADDNNQHSTAESELLNDKRVNAHEYFHVYQAAHKVYRGDGGDGFGWSTTRWVEEGVAVYFEQAISERMRWQGTVALGNRVKEDLTSMKSFSARFPGISIRDVDSEARTERLISYCGKQCIGALQYEFGHIAFRYLESKASQEKILFDYWDAAAEHGWAAAFELVFDQSLTSFYSEFEAFLQLSVDEQLIEFGISP